MKATPTPPDPPQPPGPPKLRPDLAARAAATFNSALERPLGERAAFIAGECAGDDELRRHVQRLLAAHEGADGFLEQPPTSPEIEEQLARLKPEEAGDRIGPYKLLQEIGVGGFGTVWMADQEMPVRRRVALKIIKMGMDTKEVIARFEQERQALAMMDHPNIARVFDAGATQYGRPFFVMELVRGVKLTDYCDEQGLSTDERIELFIHVCQAVQHAHQKGIIHRDLKPSNILVTINDGKAVPKVIDFGVAKATQGRLAEGTLFTKFEQMIGTPLYMSPEQAEMTSLDVDTRSDIYALGVLLYELLTGRTPIDTVTMAKAGMDEIRRLIREVDPPRPSQRLKTLDGNELTTMAKRRHTEPAKLSGALRGDLDWIVMKCIEKDRNRRYDTANGLVLDLQRHLANEVVIARPPTAGYLLSKLIRRNRLAFAAAGAVALALVAGLAVSIWFYTREAEAHGRALAAETQQKQLREAAEAARQQAEGAAKNSQDVLRYFRDMFRRAGGHYADKVTVAQMLDINTEDAADKFRDQPEVSASVQYSIGFCYSKIGRWKEARSFLERALRLQEKLWGYESPQTLETARELASVAMSQRQEHEAVSLCEKILDATKSQIGRHPEQRSTFRELELFADRKLVQIYLENGNFARAKPLIDELVLAAESAELRGTEAGHAWDTLGTLALSEGRPQDALKAYAKAQTFYSEGNPVQSAWLQGMQGAAYLALGEYAKAEPLMDQSLPVLQKRFGDSHFRVQRAFRDFIQLYTLTGRPQESSRFREKLIAETLNPSVETE